MPSPAASGRKSSSITSKTDGEVMLLLYPDMSFPESPDKFFQSHARTGKIWCIEFCSIRRLGIRSALLAGTLRALFVPAGVQFRAVAASDQLFSASGRTVNPFFIVGAGSKCIGGQLNDLRSRGVRRLGEQGRPARGDNVKLERPAPSTVTAPEIRSGGVRVLGHQYSLFRSDSLLLAF